MSKKALLPQSVHHVYIYDEDWEFLETRFGQRHGIEPVGVSFVLKELVHKQVTSWREAENKAATTRMRSRGVT